MMSVVGACGTDSCTASDSVETSNVDLAYSFVEVDTVQPFTYALMSNGLNPVSIIYGSDSLPQKVEFPALQGFVPAGHYPFHLRVESIDTKYGLGSIYNFEYVVRVDDSSASAYC